jgi:serine/threonine protein kinase
MNDKCACIATLFASFNFFIIVGFGCILPYSAPPPLRSQGHGLSADLWSLGVFLYELVAGTTPFGSEGGGNETDIYKRILSYQKVKHRRGETGGY